MQSLKSGVPLVPWGCFASEAKQVLEQLPVRRKIAIIGCTGSIGISTLELVRKFPDKLEVYALASYGTKPDLMAEQIKEFKPKKAAVYSDQAANELLGKTDLKVEAGEQAISDLCCEPHVDIVLAAIVGVAGLKSVLAALQADKVVALANKESMVVAGALIQRLAKAKQDQHKNLIILPVDSEHAAIFQALQGVHPEEVSSITLTASGGPFLRKTINELSNISVEQAISHPRWKMGAKISVDSATLINKGLELIEAHYLFGLESEKLNAIIHPQSIIHGIVNLCDGSSLLQAAYPDMQEPIAQALSYPNSKLAGITKTLNFLQIGKLEFEQIDNSRFPAVQLALNCIQNGAEECLTFNQANEQVVSAFLQNKIKFNTIVPFVQEMLGLMPAGSFYDMQSLTEYINEVDKICEMQLNKIKEY